MLEEQDNFENGENQKIIDDLQQLGFTINDAKVYVALLTLGVSNPASIAEISGVDRARVYDSLKRLSKREIIDEELVKRAPNYKAKPPSFVFEKLRKELTEKITLSKDIESKLQTIRRVSKDTSIWALNSSQLIFKEIETIITNANKYIKLILTPDISTAQNQLEILCDMLINKKETVIQIEIDIAFSVSDLHTILVKKLLNKGIAIYHWSAGAVLPFGMYGSENAFVFTILNSVGGIPEYNFGMTIDNASEGLLNGLNHMTHWVFVNLCKQVGIKKKTNE